MAKQPKDQPDPTPSPDAQTASDTQAGHKPDIPGVDMPPANMRFTAPDDKSTVHTSSVVEEDPSGVTTSDAESKPKAK